MPRIITNAKGERVELHDYTKEECAVLLDEMYQVRSTEDDDFYHAIYTRQLNTHGALTTNAVRGIKGSIGSNRGNRNIVEKSRYVHQELTPAPIRAIDEIQNLPVDEVPEEPKAPAAPVKAAPKAKEPARIPRRDGHRFKRGHWTHRTICKALRLRGKSTPLLQREDNSLYMAVYAAVKKDPSFRSQVNRIYKEIAAKQAPQPEEGIETMLAQPVGLRAVGHEAQATEEDIVPQSKEPSGFVQAFHATNNFARFLMAVSLTGLIYLVSSHL